MASLSSKRKTSVNRRLQKRDPQAAAAPKAAAGKKEIKAVFGAGPTLPGVAAAGFDQARYSQLKTRFDTALSDALAGAWDVKQVMRVLVQQEFDVGGRDAALQMQPYIVKYVAEYRDRQSAAAAAI